jgi:hypothetical protein
VGSPPPVGDIECQKNVWFQIWAAWLNTPPSVVRMSSSSDLFASGLPSVSWFSFTT